MSYNEYESQNKIKEEKKGNASSDSGAGPLKRGQRGKMKKMKKYKDQDDEERELRMQLLQVIQI